MKNFYSLIILVLLQCILFSCGGGKDEVTASQQVTVQYRITVSDKYRAVAAFTSANYTIISEDDIKGTWTSEIFNIDRNQVTISVGADPYGINYDAAEEGELHVEILVDGTVAKQAMATGKTISVSVSLGTN